MTAKDRAFAVLEAVGNLPTAPFHELAVLRHLACALRTHGVEVRQDRFGNLLARFRQGSGARPLALVAHMDHPGLTVTRTCGQRVAAAVLGGLRPEVLVPGTSLRFYDDRGSHAGVVREYMPAAGRLGAAVSADVDAPVAPTAFGTLAMPPCTRMDGDYVALPAADDLAQCAVMLLVAERLAASGDALDVTLVFTRAEELGMIGATLVARASLLSRDTTVISLECSAALPGAKAGGGPVIRVGDALQSFDRQGEALLLTARDRLVQQGMHHGGGGVPRVQRQLLSGGACEASAFLAQGYAATGLALPLGNYHNADPQGQAAPEYIHLDDLCSAVDLLLAAIAETAHPLAERDIRLSYLADRAAGDLADSARRWRLDLPAAPFEHA